MHHTGLCPVRGQKAFQIGDLHQYRCFRLNLSAITNQLNIKEPRRIYVYIAVFSGIFASFLLLCKYPVDLRPGSSEILKIRICFRPDFFCLENGSRRNLCGFIICHRDFEGHSISRHNICRDLGIRHLHHKLIPVFHGDSQPFFTHKRLQADQSPVTGFDSAAVDLSDLFFCKFSAVQAFQSLRLFQLSDCSSLIGLPDPYQPGTAEFHVCHICHEYLCRLADRYMVQMNCVFIWIVAFNMLFRLIRFCRVFTAYIARIAFISRII